ncbi:DNA-binding protein [Blautia glucerasea]|uniref:DNA-binding protein n=1 Tax=Blautia glucerasea TaxID=536633 RepID=UPI00156E5C51|nr:DNA-binding protein [Blautia glucerasea]NSJ27989.1 DNA-binding protein [Blautia glucerasea]
MKQYLTAKEVAESMGVSVGKAYGIIRELNSQLDAKGYITVSGKINRTYFFEKCCYGSREDNHDI